MKRRDFLQNCTMGVSVVAGSWAGNSLAAENESQKSARIDADRLQQSAMNHFTTGGRTCCESILLAGCEALGIEDELVPDIALGLAGGIGLQGDACGVLTSSAMVMSLAVGREETEYAAKKKQTFQAVGRIHAEFKREFGCTDCRSLCGLDLTTPEGRKRLKEVVKAKTCTKYVSFGAELLGRQLVTV